MGIFNWFNKSESSEKGYGDSDYTNDELLGIYKNLTYQECKSIYRYFPLGKRLASALPNYAMSAERELIFKDMPPELAEEFKKAEKKLNINSLIRQTCIYSRIYGLSALYAVSDNITSSEPLTIRHVWNNGISFNVLDPLNIAGYYVSQNANLVNYQKVENIRIQGGDVCARNRATIIFNDIPLFIQFNPSSFSFTPPSIYQNMTGLIKSWNRCLIALERLATKAASIVVKSNSLSHASGINYGAIQKNLQLIRNMENDGIAGLDEKGQIEFFQLTGVEEIDKICQQINTSLMMALSDTPSALLLDKNLSNGLNDGTEDMKAIVMSVDNFRRLALSPLYDFTDPYVMTYAFNEDFINKMKTMYKSDFSKYGTFELLTIFKQAFSFKWGNLYPEPEEQKTQNKLTKLELLQKAKELGANQNDIENELNTMEIFKTNITLDNFNNDINSEDYNNINSEDYNNINSEDYNDINSEDYSNILNNNNEENKE